VVTVVKDMTIPACRQYGDKLITFHPAEKNTGLGWLPICIGLRS
jgi:hypothetical protein